MSEKALISSLIVSDRASLEIYEDRSGPAIKEWMETSLNLEFDLTSEIVPDERPLIEIKLKELADQRKRHLVLTSGGTGPALRDVTPEATLNVADKVLPGFGERMRMIGLQYVPTAILSRQVGAIRGKTLIINLPGQPNSINQTLDVLFEAVPYCVELIGGPFLHTKPDRVKAFRPKSAPPLRP